MLSIRGVMAEAKSVYDPSHPINHPIFDRAIVGDIDGVRRYVAWGFDPRAHDNLLLCAACEHGHVNVVKWLVEDYGIDIGIGNVVAWALRSCDEAMVRYVVRVCLSRDMKIDSALLALAVNTGDVRIVTFMIDECDVSSGFGAAVAAAIRNDADDMLACLLSHGAELPETD